MSDPVPPCYLCGSVPCVTRCAICGGHAPDGVCGMHYASEPGWAAENRVLCDFIHRGIPLPRLPVEEREALT